MAICALHPQEAIGGVANSRWQNFVPEHGVDDGALPIARPRRKQHSLGCQTVVPSLGSGVLPSAMSVASRQHWKEDSVY